VHVTLSLPEGRELWRFGSRVKSPKWLNRVGVMAVTISVESPLQDDVRALIAALNEHLLVLTPPEFCSHMTVEQMADADTTVFIARDHGRAVACGALRRHRAAVGEVKRMYTLPSHQGQGIGGRILAMIESLAREEGLTRLVLETGHRHDAAWRVYERSGFARCGPVLAYPPSEYSVFYEKPIASL
jgi:putative acetyltransferase